MSDTDNVSKKQSEERHERVPADRPEDAVVAKPVPQDGEYFTAYPNRWAQMRATLREPFAEFLGTMILVMFGAGVDAQASLSLNPGVASSPRGDWLSVSWGWAIGIGVGVWVSGGISGGHINPAVTLTLATFRGFPWKKVPIYWFAQLMGALIGALLVYANYFHAIDIVEGGRGIRTVPGTASIFANYAAPYLTNVSAFFDEFLGTFLLLVGIFAITDKKNGPPPPGLVPLALTILFLGIGACFGMNNGFAVNPARDLGPRIATAMVGYGREVFNFRNQYWIWCPIMGPFLGGLFGGLVYDLLIFTGGESPINRPDAASRAHHERAPHTARQNAPAGVESV